MKRRNGKLRKEKKKVKLDERKDLPEQIKSENDKCRRKQWSVKREKAIEKANGDNENDKHKQKC